MKSFIASKTLSYVFYTFALFTYLRILIFTATQPGLNNILLTTLSCYAILVSLFGYFSTFKKHKKLLMISGVLVSIGIMINISITLLIIFSPELRNEAQDFFNSVPVDQKDPTITFDSFFNAVQLQEGILLFDNRN